MLSKNRKWCHDLKIAYGVKVIIGKNSEISSIEYLSFHYLFDLMLNVPVNSYGHVEMVSSPNPNIFLSKLDLVVNQYFVHHTCACNLESAEGRRMSIEIISWSISTWVWDLAGITLATPGSAVRHVSAVKHVTDCPTQPGFPFIRIAFEAIPLSIAKNAEIIDTKVFYLS